MKTGYPNVALDGNQLGYGLPKIALSSPVVQRQPWGLRFTVVGLSLALFCCRIGLPLGLVQVSFVGPAVLALAGWGFLKGHLLFQKTRLGLFILLCSLTLASSAIDVIEPQRFGFGPSWLSMGQFLILTSLMTLRFAEPVDERHFFAAVNTVLAVIALAGLLEFFLQFVGLGLFSFHDIIPDKLSFEVGWNLQNPIGSTKYLKSNGFFLLEPSMFSQYMALGLSIEILTNRRLRYIGLMLAGLIVSLSGTGWLILGAFIVAVGVGLKGRGVALAIATASLLATGMFILAFVSPDFFDSFAGRIGEFSSPGSSAHARFVAPFWTVRDVLWREPWALWSGVGAGGGERLGVLPYVQSMNTPVKLLIEYGLPVMLTYVTLLSAGSKTRAQWILLPPGLVMVLFTGSYAQTPPLLYPIVLIICIATLKPAINAAQQVSGIPLRRVSPRTSKREHRTRGDQTERERNEA